MSGIFDLFRGKPGGRPFVRGRWAWGVRLTLVTALSLMVVAASAAPNVTNVRASQRSDGSGLVDVWYDLSGLTGSALVSLYISNDAGAHYNVLPSSVRLSGDVGPGVANGTNRHIVWDVLRDRPQINWAQCKARVTAGETGQAISLMLRGVVPLEMVRIPAGTFTMGSVMDTGYSQPNEMPLHNVTIPNDFYLGKFEVTQEQWVAVMGSNPSYFVGNQRPVEQVSWGDCQAFIAALNTLGLGTFRLPTEAEWEYACRAGSATRWGFGDEQALLGDYAWCSGNSSTSQPVGQKLPNAFGLYDMHGNVWEWVQDYWYGDYNGAPTDGSAWEDATQPNRVFRGGSWASPPVECLSAHRAAGGPDSHMWITGLRLVRTP